MIDSQFILTKFAVVANFNNLRERQYFNAFLEASCIGLVQLILHINDGIHIGALIQQGLELWQQIVRGDYSCNFSFTYA